MSHRPLTGAVSFEFSPTGGGFCKDVEHQRDSRRMEGWGIWGSVRTRVQKLSFVESKDDCQWEVIKFEFVMLEPAWRYDMREADERYRLTRQFAREAQGLMRDRELRSRESSSYEFSRRAPSLELENLEAVHLPLRMDTFTQIHRATRRHINSAWRSIMQP